MAQRQNPSLPCKLEPSHLILFVEGKQRNPQSLWHSVFQEFHLFAVFCSTRSFCQALQAVMLFWISQSRFCPRV